METTRIILTIQSHKMGTIQRCYDINNAIGLSPDAEKKAIMDGLTELAENVELTLRRTPDPKPGEILVNGQIVKLPPWDERVRQLRTEAALSAARAKEAEERIVVSNLKKGDY